MMPEFDPAAARRWMDAHNPTMCHQFLFGALARIDAQERRIAALEAEIARLNDPCACGHCYVGNVGPGGFVGRCACGAEYRGDIGASW